MERDFGFCFDYVCPKEIRLRNLFQGERGKVVLHLRRS